MKEKIERALPIVAVPLLAAGFLIAFFTYLLPIGMISDDFVILERAKSGDPLWTIHYSWTLQWIWKWLSQGIISPKILKIFVLAVHLLNAVLTYYFLTLRWGFSKRQAQVASLLVLLSPSGVEALAWSCCLGYVLTLCFILSSLLVTGYRLKRGTCRMGFEAACLLAVALLTWDWGVLIVPTLLLSVWFSDERPAFTQILRYFIPSFAVLIAYAWMRTRLDLETVYGVSGIAFMAKFLFVSPLLALAPNLDKSFFTSPGGIITASAVWGAALLIAYRDRRGRFFISVFLLTLLPWLIGGYPSSRYYYLSAPFLFALVPLINLKKRRTLIPALFLMVQFHFFLERAELWNLADREVRKLEDAFRSLAMEDNSGKKLVLVNVPDAFGPESFPMRPQAWHSGLEAFIPQAVEIKVPGVPYIWADGGMRLRRDEINEMFSREAVYEIVLEDGGKFGEFSIVPWRN